MRRSIVGSLLGLLAALQAGLTASAAEQPANLVRSATSGPWSTAGTWEGGKLPGHGSRVQIKAGHAVVYDVKNGPAIRFLHVAGQLSFAGDRDTRLDVGLIKIQPGDDASENGFDCDAHFKTPDPTAPPAVMQVGTAGNPIDAKRSAVIRLTYFDGMDKETCPAIVCCGGRLDFHGSPMERTWVKLGAPASKGDAEVTLREPVPGWAPGHRLILTATTRQNKQKKTFAASTRDRTQTEERTIRKIDGAKITLDQPLAFDHVCTDDFAGEVANLTRNVVVESADLAKVRGHTMYHRFSAGSISYAEFRHLGKDGVLGKYSIHFHLCGDTMRGSSVIGAAIWDSDNRWITIHGTNYLVVRDCVGYQSKGHGFFLEDGTEVDNTLDHNLAVQAYTTKPLPKQVLPFDKNDGSGFWWANSRNAFTRNVAAECDEYGYFFQAPKTAEFDPELLIRQPDGTRKKVDVRTVPFIRFEDNEAHCQRRHSFNLGGGAPFGPPDVGGVGPDVKHPFVIRNLRLWDVHWGIHPAAPSVLLDNIGIFRSDYGIWRPAYTNHSYTRIKIIDVPNEHHYAFVGNKPPNDFGDFPKPLEPVDELAPVTVITHAGPRPDGRIVVRGTTSDNGEVKKVVVNGKEATATQPNFAEWEIVFDSAAQKWTAHAEDAAGNVEKVPHVLK
jgi:hypothetical protein